MHVKQDYVIELARNNIICLSHLQFVEASGLEDFHLLGLSLGALVSAAYATQHGERIASLTVMCPPGKSECKIFRTRSVRVLRALMGSSWWRFTAA